MLLVINMNVGTHELCPHPFK